MRAAFKSAQLFLFTLWFSAVSVVLFAGFLSYFSTSGFNDICYQLLDERTVLWLAGLIMLIVTIISYLIRLLRSLRISKYDLYKLLYCLMFSLFALFSNHIWGFVIHCLLFTLIISVDDFCLISRYYQKLSIE